MYVAFEVAAAGQCALSGLCLIRHVDARPLCLLKLVCKTDIWSWGVITLELVTGVQPVRGRYKMPE